MSMNLEEASLNPEKFDFKPLESFDLPGIGNLKCEGLIVIVGPNSSGKSQLLQDVYLRLCGEPRALVVATSLEVQKPTEYTEFVQWLESEGYFEKIFDDNGAEQWLPKTTYAGLGGTISQIQPAQAQSWHDTFVPTADRDTKRRSEFLNYFGRLLVTALFLNSRLNAMSSVPMIDFQMQPPQHELHALFLNDEARDRLYTELIETFGKAVWPDPSRGSVLSLRVSDQSVPTADERLSPTKMAEYRTIESEGDGLKSYVAICVALLLGRRPVCLIDEPEMCLHPPQAHSLGRFIGRHASISSNVTFTATHSSHILRGIIQTAPAVQIVRLTRSKGGFLGHLVPADVLADAVTKPTVRAESVLDGIFAQGVIVLEADSDRLVYQSTWETMADEFHQDIHFATVGGTGGIADTCKLYRTLKIPVAVVADLDVIVDLDKLKKILVVTTDPAQAESLAEKAKLVADAIRKQPPTISPAEVRKSLTAIAVDRDDWENDADIELRRELNRLAEQVDRMRQIKRKGVAGLPPSVVEEAKLLLQALSSVGIFLVPVGELEEWLDGYGIQASKRSKWAWANAAAQIVQEKGRQEGDVWDFMQSVGTYLNGRDLRSGDNVTGR